MFAKQVLGDCLGVDALQDAAISLIDIDAARLRDSELMVHNLIRAKGASATVSAHLTGDARPRMPEAQRRQLKAGAREGLAGADYVVNAIQVGGYEPSTVIDFEIPKKYGLRQTIADTLGIGGIFRALRTIPVMLDYCRIIEEVAPDALLLNYINPMAMLTGAILRATDVRSVGLCHSVQGCARWLCRMLELPEDNLHWKIAGINHQAWLLEISRDGEDLYPEIKRRAQLPEYWPKDSVRFEFMNRLGYYVTEVQRAQRRVLPWFIKAARAGADRALLASRWTNTRGAAWTRSPAGRGCASEVLGDGAAGAQAQHRVRLLDHRRAAERAGLTPSAATCSTPA